MKQKRKHNNMLRDSKPYLTKRILIRAAKKGFRKAAAETMDIMGYTATVKDGWVIKLFADGHSEQVSQIEQVEKDKKLIFD
jgi:hypothetical protein